MIKQNRNSRSNNDSGEIWLERLKLFDFYPKLDEDVPQQKTTFGGVATLLCLLFSFYLLASEFYYYAYPLREHSLKVDVTRGNKLTINIDIIFPSLVCTDIVIDAVDGIDGRPIKDASYQVIKQRLNKDGTPIAEGLAMPGSKGIFSKFQCQPCELPSGVVPRLRLNGQFHQKCCTSCDELRQYYRGNRISQHIADSQPQCLIEKPVADDEGCRIYGELNVQKMKGDFHILAGTAVDQKHDGHTHHIHHITMENINRLAHFNITHHIHKFSFGNDVHGLVNPLEGNHIRVNGLGQQIYYIQVVPTLYQSNGYQLETNQYSYNYEFRPVNSFQIARIPGIYFKYDMSPLMIEVNQSSKPFVELVTSICAIGGGMYVAFGLVYNIVFKLLIKLKLLQKQ
ncbi:DUF1692 family protein [Tieghemostelium lacteum]|uniref:DUF1692 family protein n=1 Tax=Tieghemostelium lacteum TaxID=361077 RepID=A0A151ZDD7_TIELA|nr:DUF1692 family protein [Tieghemostelium lacteum]|eukprot:KYQ91939.1 DUF1692 family protein [Tieghemostelium lacteum]